MFFIQLLPEALKGSVKKIFLAQIRMQRKSVAGCIRVIWEIVSRNSFFFVN